MIKTFRTHWFYLLVQISGLTIWAQSLRANDSEDIATPPVLTIGEETSGVNDAEGVDQELTLSADELRNGLEYIIAVGVGHGDAWQRFSLYGEKYLTPDFSLNVTIGGGGFQFNEAKEGTKFRLRVDARSLQFGQRYYLPATFPFYIQVGESYSWLQTHSVPLGMVNEATSADNLRFSGQLETLTLSAQIGMQFLWSMRLVGDIGLIGYSQSWVINEQFTRASTPSRRIARKQLQRGQSWGLLNFKVGYWF